MKVYGQSCYRYKDTSTIMLKDRWLKELGFEIGEDAFQYHGKSSRNNIACKHPVCAALIPHGKMYCDEHKPLHTKDRAHDSERGYGVKWQREGKGYLRNKLHIIIKSTQYFARAKKSQQNVDFTRR